MKDLNGRLLDFATTGFKLAGKMGRSAGGKYLANQLMRSSASAGANYHEACGAESRADFTHKLQLVLKEPRETEFWLKLAGNSGVAEGRELQPAITEADELSRIIAQSVLTVKKRLK